MKKLQQILALSACLFYLINNVSAQQTPRMSQYNFAPGLYNPAAVGRHDKVTFGGAFRGQWIGIDGAPNTQVLFVDKSNDRVGLGAQFRNDVAGTLGISDVQAAYSYKLPLGENAALRGGLSASLANWRNDPTKLRLDDIDDPQFMVNINRWLPNFGAGLQLDSKWGQVGFGVPQLFEFNLNEDIDAVAARTFRHYFIQASGNISLNDNALRIVPQGVLASASLFNGARKAPRDGISAPNALDLGVTAIVQETWHGGIQWRTALERSLSSDHALGIMAGWTGKSGLGVMGVYELPLNAIRRVSGVTFELMLTYQLKSKSERTPKVSPPIIKEDVEEAPNNTPEPPGKITPLPYPAPKPETTPPVVPEPPTEPQVANQTISGIVFDMTTGLPCVGARLTIANTCGKGQPSAFITGADGRYSFDVAKDCCFVVTAQKDNRKTANSERICNENKDEGRILRADLELYPL
jgi:type IX secretion system PorP/SprF family membrane protein